METKPITWTEHPWRIVYQHEACLIIECSFPLLSLSEKEIDQMGIDTSDPDAYQLHTAWIDVGAHAPWSPILTSDTWEGATMAKDKQGCWYHLLIPIEEFQALYLRMIRTVPDFVAFGQSQIARAVDRAGSRRRWWGAQLWRWFTTRRQEAALNLLELRSSETSSP